MSASLLVAIIVGAVYRITRVVVADVVAEPIRDWAHRRWSARHTEEDDELDGIAYLLTCPWCTSIWVGLVVAPLGWITAGPGAADSVASWIEAALIALTASAVTGNVATREPES